MNIKIGMFMKRGRGCLVYRFLLIGAHWNIQSLRIKDDFFDYSGFRFIRQGSG